MGQQRSNQVGGQGGGVSGGVGLTGNSNKVNTGTEITSTTNSGPQVSGSANTISYTTNGVSADSLKDILGTVTKPSASEVASATPSPLTLPASPTATVAVAGSNQKKYITYAIIAVVLVVAFALIRKFLK